MKGGGKIKCSHHVKHTLAGVSGRCSRVIRVFQDSDKSLSHEVAVTLA